MSNYIDEELKQGAKANLNGKIIEQTILPQLTLSGYTVYKYSDTVKNPEIMNEKKVVITNMPFKSVYGHRGKTEYLIINTARGKRIRVESKHQASAGSVDEKFCNLFLNTVYAYPEDEIILLIQGEGFKVQAKEWLRNAVNEFNKASSEYMEALATLQPMLAPGNTYLKPKKVHMFDLSEFINYFFKELN